MFRRSFLHSAAPLVVSALLIAAATVAAGPQEQEKARPPVPNVDKDHPPRSKPIKDLKTAKALIDKMIAEYDLTPHPSPLIPDHPPPHEGAMIDLPYVMAPPDLVLVEVLEAAPGRPISGERLIRPDGKISLGFYGEVPARGLTLPQLKVAIVKHLRAYLSDQTLGLLVEDYSGESSAEPEPGLRPAFPEIPENRTPFQDLDESKPGPAPKSTSGRPRSGKLRSAVRLATGARIPIRRIQGLRAPKRPEEKKKADEPTNSPTKAEEKKTADSSLNSVVIPFPGQGTVKITIEIQGQGAFAPLTTTPAEPVRWPPFEGPWYVVALEDTDRVFVDITAYNSKNYYVQGLVQTPGRLPWTGAETVLDAIQSAGGLLAGTDPSNIILVRPGRNGGPPRTYHIDLPGIRDRGEVATNYQLFPGDRLVVGSRAGEHRQAHFDPTRPPIRPAGARSIPTIRATDSPAEIGLTPARAVGNEARLHSGSG